MALSDYTQLEYIESTGSQFIAIDYIPKTLHTKYELGFMRTGISGYWNPIINSEEDVRFGIMCTIDGNNSSNYGQFHIGPAGSGFKSVQFPISSNIRYDIIADKTGISLNGINYSVSGVGDATGQWSTYINHRKKTSSAYSDEYSIGRWYYLKVYEDDDLIKNYIPARRKSDNVLGMYEQLEDKFYINNGTGNFTAGPIKDDIINYQKLKYIESTGTQYIDTLFCPNQDTTCEISFYKNTNNACRIFGAWSTSYYENTFSIGTDGPDNSYVGYDGQYDGGDNGKKIPTISNGNHVVGLYKNVYKLDDNIIKTYNYQNFTCTKSIYLFAQHTHNEALEQYGAYRLYYCKIWNNNTLVRDFIPVQRKLDNVLGLYDKVNDVFYMNKGTGTFIAGSNKYDGSQLRQNLEQIQDELNLQLNNMYVAFPELYIPYKELEYIESNGTQYIDLGITPDPTTNIEVTFKHTGSNTSYWDRVWGQNSSAGNCKYQIEAIRVPKWKLGLNGTTVEISLSARTKFETVKLDGDGKYYVNNTQLGTLNTSVTNNYNIWIFRGYDRYSYIQISRAKLWKNNQLIRDMIPVKRKSDNVICMYDKISKQFFTNNGTGTFIAGPEV